MLLNVVQHLHLQPHKVPVAYKLGRDNLEVDKVKISNFNLKCGYALILAVITGSTIAAPGVIQDAPLELGEYVQPNILVLLDDSGSMDWEVLKTNGAISVHGSGSNSGNMDFTPDNNTEIRELCVGYNAMAYDPNEEYTPWFGEDINNNAYTDKTLTNVVYNPYFPDEDFNDNPDESASSDISNHFYIEWDDDGDGVYQNGECFVPSSYTAPLTASACAAGSSTCRPVSLLPTNAQAEAAALASGNPRATNTQENYANWYNYYRKREFVAKRALSEVITDSTERVGIATLHNNNGVGTIIRNIDDSSGNATAEGNKETLLRNLSRVNSSGGTPLRSNFEQVGQYFQSGVSVSSGLFGTVPSHSSPSETVSSDSPILSEANGGACQRNFAMVFSDGFWNNDTSWEFDNHDGADNTGEIEGLDGGIFADTVDNTLADVAMRYLEFDLSGLADRVGFDDPYSDSELNHQHLISYTVTFGLSGSLDRNIPPTDPTFAGWPTPVSNTNTTVDDMWHAAVNGRGENLNARNPAELIQQIQDAFADFQGESASGSAATFNTGFVSSGAFIYQGKYTPDDWSGDLLAFNFDSDGIDDTDTDGQITDADAIWSASASLASQLSGTGWQSRNVFTHNGSEGVRFQFPANYETLLSDGSSSGTGLISDRQIIDLLENAPFDSAATSLTEIALNQSFGEAIVDYFRGDVSREQVFDANGNLVPSADRVFRARNNQFLGPVVHSSPQFIGAPNEPYPNLIEPTNPYNVFQTAQENRAATVYIGANDGMLHAFNAETGQERFAYIPGALQNDLHLLTEPSYTYNAYVDGTPTIRDVFIGNQWRTFLIGAMRAGGKGIFILDVTNPTVFSENDILAEFTHPDLGFTFSRPQIARLNNDRWAVIFGNGYNPDGDSASTGTAKLFILYLDSLSDGIDPSDYIILDTGVGTIVNTSCTDPNSDCNGMSSPTLADLDGNFTTDRVYVGDVQGNLWAFNLESDQPTDWADSDNRTLLFTACTAVTTSGCSQANRQPITTRPETRRHPARRSSATDPNVMVYFGTGQLVAQGDNSTTEIQTFYGVWDAASGTGNAAYANLTKDDLQEQTITDELLLSDNAVSYDGNSNFGWYINFETPTTGVFDGGRSIVDSLLVGDVLFFNVNIPEPTPCQPTGSSYLFAVDAYDGTESDFLIFDTDGDGYADASTPIQANVQATAGLGGVQDKLVETGALGGVNDTNITTKQFIPAGRKTWSILDR